MSRIWFLPLTQNTKIDAEIANEGHELEFKKRKNNANTKDNNNSSYKINIKNYRRK